MMIPTKVMLRILVFSLVFTMIATHQAWGKNKENCEEDKNSIKSKYAKSALQSALNPVHPKHVAML